MCGLVGCAGDLFHSHKEAFINLLTIDAVRGEHATGVASMDGGGIVDYIKRVGPPPDLVNIKTFDRVVTVNKKILLGHNRLATRGSHTSANAHPFAFKHIVGAHNGTIPESAIKALDTHGQFETDSECIFWEINCLIDVGVSWDDAVREVVGKLRGAWALTFFIPKERRICFLRNKERPLCYAFSDDRKVMFWASEGWMIRGACSRNKIKILDDKVWLINEDTLTSFKMPTMGSQFDQGNRSKVEGKPDTVISNFQSAGTSTHLGPPATSTKKAKRDLFPTDHKGKHFKPPYKDPYLGTIISKPDFNKRILAGGSCVYCNDHTPTWGEEVLFLRKSPVGSEQYACKTCIHDPDVMTILRAMR